MTVGELGEVLGGLLLSGEDESMVITEIDLEEGTISFEGEPHPYQVVNQGPAQ